MLLPVILELLLYRGAYVYHQHPVTCNTEIRRCRRAYVRSAVYTKQAILEIACMADCTSLVV
jgi:hypothetical protein